MKIVFKMIGKVDIRLDIIWLFWVNLKFLEMKFIMSFYLWVEWNFIYKLVNKRIEKVFIVLFKLYINFWIKELIRISFWLLRIE